MVATLPYELTEYLEKRLGKEETREFVKFFEKTAESFEEKANNLALEKKLELKDELTKELATKADLQILRSEIQSEIFRNRNELENKIDKIDMKLTYRLNFLIALSLIALTLMNPVVAKLISNWLKLGL